MSQTLERVLISGTAWQLIDLDNAKLHDIQNATNVQLQWSYTNTLSEGTNFNVGEILRNISQDIYIRAITIPRKGFLSIVSKAYAESAGFLKIIDDAGRSNVIGTFGEQWATDVKNDVLGQWSYGISTRETKNRVETNGGTVSITNSNMLTVSTGTSANGLAGIESYNSVRYRPGHTILSHFTALFTDSTATNTRQWIGVADGDNGFALGFNDGKFAVIRIRDGIYTYAYEEELNGDIALSNIDFTKLNTFRITFGYLGSAPAAFEILAQGQSSFRVIHTMRFHGEVEETHILLPYLPVRMQIENTGNTTDCQIKNGSWHGGVMGLCQDCGNRPFHYPITPGAETKLNIGTTVTPIAAFRSKEIFHAFVNKIRAKLDLFNYIAYDGDGIVTVQLISGATIDGTEGVDYNFTDIDTNNSVMQVSTDLTSFTGGTPRLTLEANPTTLGSKQTSITSDLDAEKLGLFLDPGQVYIISASINIGTVDINWSANWTELF